MSDASSIRAEPVESLLESLRAAGAARTDPVGWHYIEVLARRIRTQTGPVQALLQARLDQALHQFRDRMAHAPASPAPLAATSPLAALLQDMAPAPSVTQPLRTGGWRTESPRVQQFRRQLRKISVQKQVSQAMAQAPLNAGPINSHRLVLRSLSLMRDVSPDYLNRFMTYIDTLLTLDDAQRLQPLSVKAAPVSRSGKKKSAS